MFDRHPDLSIELVFTAHRMDIVEEGIDLAVREGQLPDSSLIATKLSDTHIVLCASPAYLDRKAAPTELHALSEHDIVSVPVAGPAFPDESDYRTESGSIYVHASL